MQLKTRKATPALSAPPQAAARQDTAAEIDAWARHAAASNGFGDAGLADTAAEPRREERATNRKD